MFRRTKLLASSHDSRTRSLRGGLRFCERRAQFALSASLCRVQHSQGKRPLGFPPTRRLAQRTPEQRVRAVLAAPAAPGAAGAREVGEIQTNNCQNHLIPQQHSKMRTSPGRSSRSGSRKKSDKEQRDAVAISLEKLRERAEAHKPSTWELFVASFARALEEIAGNVPGQLQQLSSCNQPTIRKADDAPSVAGAEAPPKWILLEDASAVAQQTAAELEEKSKQLEVRRWRNLSYIHSLKRASAGGFLRSARAVCQ